jgi:general secretion pathway protein M
MNKLRDWVANLSVRERRLVYGAAALLSIALVYLVLVLPFTTMDRKLSARVQQKTADLAWMKQVAPQAVAAAGVTASNSGESLVVLVDRTAREAGLGAALRDQSPGEKGGLRLRVEGASFDVLVTWLASLQQQHGVGLDLAMIDAAGPGLVNATLSLTQPGSTG